MAVQYKSRAYAHHRMGEMKHGKCGFHFLYCVDGVIYRKPRIDVNPSIDFIATPEGRIVASKSYGANVLHMSTWLRGSRQESRIEKANAP